MRACCPQDGLRKWPPLAPDAAEGGRLTRTMKNLSPFRSRIGPRIPAARQLRAPFVQRKPSAGKESKVVFPPLHVVRKETDGKQPQTELRIAP